MRKIAVLTAAAAMALAGCGVTDYRAAHHHVVHHHVVVHHVVHHHVVHPHLGRRAAR